MADETIIKARERFVELSKIIGAADAVREEHATLYQFLQMADKMVAKFTSPSSEASAEVAPQNGSAPAREERGTEYRISRTVTADMSDVSIPDRVEWILKRHGEPMHLNDIFIEMRRTGWHPRGDDIKDKKTLTVSLATRKHRFNNLGGNLWELVPGGTKGKRVRML